MADVSQPPPLPAVRRNAQVLSDAGDSAAARRLLTQAIEAGRPAYGEDDREVLATAHLLARLHVQADDPAAARRVLEEALAAGLRRWGDADPLLLAISFDLGTVAEELGNRHEARRNFTRVATAGPAALGADHWTVRAARDYLGGEPPSAGASAPAAEPHTPRPALADTTIALPSSPSISPPSWPLTTPRFTPSPTQPSPTRPGPAQPGPTQAGPAEPAPPLPAPAQPAQSGSPVPGPTRPAPPQPGPVYPGQTYPATPSHQLSSYPVITTSPTAAPAPAPVARGRGATIAAAVAAAVAVLAAAVVVVVALADRPASAPGPTPTGPSTGPAVGGEPPTDLALRDDGAAITITWTDPTGGGVPFIVAGARRGQQLGAMASIDPGGTSHTVNGLSPLVDYCFTVLAVYSTETYATSGQVCTNRGG
jgi:hypothetical protein